MSRRFREKGCAFVEDQTSVLVLVLISGGIRRRMSVKFGLGSVGIGHRGAALI